MHLLRPGQGRGMRWFRWHEVRPGVRVGWSPGCLVWSLVLSIGLTILLNVALRAC